MQSDLNDCFAKIKIYLEQGSLVCFIGTTCQVYGLMTYLKKKYRNLLTIDLVCHGTPSPKLWEKYLSEQKSKYHSEIENVVFRNKTYGYHSGTMRIQFKNGIVYYGSARVDPMLKSFFTEISSRPSCYNCRFKTLERCSDFTIYDCWHVSDLVDNLTDDDKGFTNLIVQSSKGAKLLSEIADRYEIYPTDLMTAIKLDGVMIQHSAKSHPKRGEYYMDLDKESLKMHVQRFIPIRKQDYLIERSKGILYRMGIYKILKKLYRQLSILLNDFLSGGYMIQIKNKVDCCGCTACANICPKQAITMKPDPEGFLYPVVNEENCINCGVCDATCPIHNKIDRTKEKTKGFILRVKDEKILFESTSGGGIHCAC